MPTRAVSSSTGSSSRYEGEPGFGEGVVMFEIHAFPFPSLGVAVFCVYITYLVCVGLRKTVKAIYWYTSTQVCSIIDLTVAAAASRISPTTIPRHLYLIEIHHTQPKPIRLWYTAQSDLIPLVGPYVKINYDVVVARALRFRELIRQNRDEQS